MVDNIIIKVVSVFFLLGGILHWLIIFGVMKEDAPALITIYFHSLALFDILTAYGLWFRKEWGRKLGLVIAMTQIPAHGYMLYLELGTGVGWERLADLLFAMFYIIYFQRQQVRKVFI